MATLTQQLFSTTDGIIYKIMENIMGRGNAPDILATPKYFYGLIVGQNVVEGNGIWYHHFPGGAGRSGYGAV